MIPFALPLVVTSDARETKLIGLLGPLTNSRLPKPLALAEIAGMLLDALFNKTSLK